MAAWFQETADVFKGWSPEKIKWVNQQVAFSGPWTDWSGLGKKYDAQHAIDTWNPSQQMATYKETYQPYIDKMKAYAWDDQGAWKGPTYTPVGDYTNQYQGSIDSLLARIQQGTTASDTDAAFNQMAQLYGMTPDEFRAMQGQAYNTSAEDITNQAQTMAMSNDAMMQQFEAMIRSEQKASTAAMGKQLETIFAERGGLGGFAQAYEMTSALSDSLLQQKTQFIMDRYSQALQTVNADLDRKMTIVQSGQETAQQFLADRWNQIQTAYGDLMTAANQSLQEYEARVGANSADYQANLQAFLAPLEAMRNEMMTQLGVDQAGFDYIQSIYDSTIAPLIDALTMAEL